MKKVTAPKNTKDHSQAQILNNNQKLISANVLRIIAKFGLIKMIDANLIEHDHARVNELLQNNNEKQLKLDNILMD